MTVKEWRGDSRYVATGGMNERLRVAWLGPEPEKGGGVAGCAWLLLRGLAQEGCRIDCYVTGDDAKVKVALEPIKGLGVINVDLGWRYDRWYSRHSTSKFVTRLACRAWERRRLAELLLRNHRREPYDVVYQFSTIELFGIRKHLRNLPPVVLHPEVHAAGELRWLRREQHLASMCEPAWRRLLISGVQAIRARRQQRDIRVVQRVAMISRRFGEELATDYGVRRENLSLVRNPVDLDELHPRSRTQPELPLRIVFVGRISVRKGVELVVEMSNRLTDLRDRISLEIVGAETLWSDYRPLLAGLDTRIARYHGYMDRHTLVKVVADSDLLIHPAKYEPFGLTVAEALALGVPVIATSAVGATEDVSPDCCVSVPVDDPDALESAIRLTVGRLLAGERREMAAHARAEAERLFEATTVTRSLLKMLRAAASSGAASERDGSVAAGAPLSGE
jgi:glycosyltransferase involved in cell wall biosynthesis